MFVCIVIFLFSVINIFIEVIYPDVLGLNVTQYLIELDICSLMYGIISTIINVLIMLEINIYKYNLL